VVAAGLPVRCSPSYACRCSRNVLCCALCGLRKVFPNGQLRSCLMTSVAVVLGQQVQFFCAWIVDVFFVRLSSEASVVVFCLSPFWGFWGLRVVRFCAGEGGRAALLLAVVVGRCGVCVFVWAAIRRPERCTGRSLRGMCVVVARTDRGPNRWLTLTRPVLCCA